MAEAYSIELRQRVVAAYESGEGSYVSLAERFALGVATVKRWVTQFRRKGHLEPSNKGGGATSEISPVELDAIVQRLGD